MADKPNPTSIPPVPVVLEANSDETRWPDYQGDVEIGDSMPRRLTHSGDWPLTPVSLSRQLRSLQASLKSYDIIITFGRGQKRWVRIQTTQTK